jgi:hypothetical protein
MIIHSVAPNGGLQNCIAVANRLDTKSLPIFFIIVRLCLEMLHEPITVAVQTQAMVSYAGLECINLATVPCSMKSLELVSLLSRSVNINGQYTIFQLVSRFTLPPGLPKYLLRHRLLRPRHRHHYRILLLHPQILLR